MGTSSVAGLKVNFQKDHPHAYGDKSPGIEAEALFVGSSPRVWGQGTVYFLTVFQFRIIPTRMGTSAEQLSSIDPAEDHPHAYGDKKYQKLQACGTWGSSPRVWGQEVNGE